MTELFTAKSNVDMMNEELKLVLESFRRQRPHLDIQKTPDVYIYQTSTPQEVQKWLEMKGFSKRYIIYIITNILLVFKCFISSLNFYFFSFFLI